MTCIAIKTPESRETHETCKTVVEAKPQYCCRIELGNVCVSVFLPWTWPIIAGLNLIWTCLCKNLICLQTWTCSLNTSAFLWVLLWAISLTGFPKDSETGISLGDQWPSGLKQTCGELPCFLGGGYPYYITGQELFLLVWAEYSVAVGMGHCGWLLADCCSCAQGFKCISCSALCCAIWKEQITRASVGGPKRQENST